MYIDGMEQKLRTGDDIMIKALFAIIEPKMIEFLFGQEISQLDKKTTSFCPCEV